MQTAYFAVLVACAAAVLALAGWRLAQLRRRPRPGRGRMLNEWTWTLIPLLVLAGLLWQALKVSK